MFAIQILLLLDNFFLPQTSSVSESVEHLLNRYKIEVVRFTLTWAKLAGKARGLPCPFLKIEKKCPDFGEKNALIVPSVG